MNLKGRLEKAEAGAGVANPPAAPCALCAFWWRVLARVYGEEFASPIHTPALCAQLRNNLRKAYGGGDDGDGLKAAA